MPTNPPDLIAFIVVILFAITIHECAHAWSADRLGDATARLMGRVTLNPIAHLDPIGVLCFVFAGFGWGKPVPVNIYNLRHPRRDNMLVSAAGPLSNLIAAAAFGLVARLIEWQGEVAPFMKLIWLFACNMVYMNVLLAVFNLIPVHPLEGSHVLEGLLPRSWADVYERLGANGPILLLILILAGRFGGVPILWYVLGPPVKLLTMVFTGHEVPGILRMSL